MENKAYHVTLHATFWFLTVIEISTENKGKESHMLYICQSGIYSFISLKHTWTHELTALPVKDADHSGR